jgi:hypothetical protein
MMMTTDRSGFTLLLGGDWETLNRMHIRVPHPYARMTLKPEELGLVAWLLSHKPGQTLSAKFAAKGMGCSVDRINAICKRLEARDVLHRHRARDERGRLGDAVWELIPPPEFRELARALAAAQGDPEPENAVLDSTSENTASETTKPQVNSKTGKTKIGKTKLGKSGPKVVQGKDSSRERDTHAATVADPPPGGGQGVVCVEEFRESAETVLRRAIHPEANHRLREVDRELLVARVSVLMQQGWGLVPLANALGGHTDAKTRRPDIVLAAELDKVELEKPPTGRAVANHAQVLTKALDRARRLLDDGPEFTRVTRWLNGAQPAEVTDWMTQTDQEIRSAEDITQDPTPAPQVASLFSAKTDGEVRRVAAARAEELGMTTEAAQEWVAGKRKYELLPWLKAPQGAQMDALPIAA